MLLQNCILHIATVRSLCYFSYSKERASFSSIVIKIRTIHRLARLLYKDDINICEVFHIFSWVVGHYYNLGMWEARPTVNRRPV